MDSIRASKSVKLVVDTLQNYLAKDTTGAAHRIHIHFCQSPVEVLGEDGQVVGLRTERTELDGTGHRGTARSTTPPTTSPGCRSTAPQASSPTTVGALSTSTANHCRAPMSPGGSNAIRSASSAIPSPTPPRRSTCCSRTSMPGRAQTVQTRSGQPLSRQPRHRLHHVARLGRARRPRDPPRRIPGPRTSQVDPRRNGAHLPRLIAPRFPKIWPILQVESASTPLELGTRWRGQTGTRGLVTAGRAVRQEHFFALLEESVLGAQTLGHPDELRLAMVAWMERNRSALLGRGEYDNRVHERIKGVPLRWDDQ
jgi:hypothetical protein